MFARRVALVGLATGALLSVSAGTALADDCSNVSRAPAPCGMDCNGPVVAGNWVWLPSIGVPVPAWGFAPPGSEDSVAVGMPGAAGNYTNGQAADLLGVAARHGTGVCSTPNRSTTDPAQAHGIVTGACSAG